MQGPDEAAVLAALRHDARSAILQACMRGARSAMEVMAETGIPAVSCYRHIHWLLGARLLVVARSAVTQEGRPYDLYRTTIESARLDLAADGTRVQWRVRGDMRDRLQRLWDQLEER